MTKKCVFSSHFKSRRAAMDVQNFGRFISTAANAFATMIMKHSLKAIEACYGSYARKESPLYMGASCTRGF